MDKCSVLSGKGLLKSMRALIHVFKISSSKVLILKQYISIMATDFIHLLPISLMFFILLTFMLTSLAKVTDHDFTIRNGY